MSVLDHVEHIHVSLAAGGPMQRLLEADAIAGLGLAGDQQATREGFWRDGRVSRDLTLVETEAMEMLATRFGIELAPGDARRNLTTCGVSLNHLADLTGKPLLRPLVHRGGLRAELLTSGRIHLGDHIEAGFGQMGVGVLVVREGTLLIGRRLARHGYATWSFPGGRPAPGETPEGCALRELFEETGLSAPRRA